METVFLSVCQSYSLLFPLMPLWHTWDVPFPPDSMEVLEGGVASLPFALVNWSAETEHGIEAAGYASGEGMAYIALPGRAETGPSM